MNRREFLKKAYQVGGLAALYSLGSGAIEEAQAWGVLPAVVGGASSAPGLWANWDEASEDTLSVDQNDDGIEDTFVCFMENPVAGGDEAGRGGGLAGADLVMTDSGGANIPGALGTPPYRTFAQNKWGVVTQACAEVVKSATWCVIWKMDNWTDAEGSLFLFFNTVNATIIRIHGIARKCYITVKGNNLGNTADGAPNDQPVWVAAQANGVDRVTCGWDTSKITRWADVPANQKVVAAAEMGDVSAQNFRAADQLIMSQATNSNNVYQVDADLFYFILSKAVLIE